MKITKVSYLKEYLLEVTFYNGKVIQADFTDFLKKAVHPCGVKYRDKKLFAGVKVQYGFLCWGNGEMEISGESIYKGEFSPKAKGFSYKRKRTLNPA